MKSPTHLQIDIPTPCHEDWDKMTPCAQGRHCAQCQKMVIDFTTWSDAALHRYFSQQTENVCGRFQVGQLNRVIHLPPQPHSRLYRLVVALGLTLMGTQGVTAYAQGSMPKTTCTPITQTPQLINTATGHLTGTVLDEKKQPITGAIVSVKRNGIVVGGAATDLDGNFDIKQLDAGTYTVTAHFASYCIWTQETNMLADTLTMGINMIPTNEPLKEVKIRNHTKGLVIKTLTTNDTAAINALERLRGSDTHQIHHQP